MSGMKIRKGDEVIVITGKDKGVMGRVVSAMPTRGKVIVEGVNVAKRHAKPKKANEPGGIIDKAMPIDVSNVAIVGADGKAARVGYQIKPDGTKVRINKRTGAEL